MHACAVQSAAPDVAVKFPLIDTALKEALASVTATDLEPLRDGLDKHAAEVLSQIVAASAPVSEYPGTHSGSLWFQISRQLAACIVSCPSAP